MKIAVSKETRPGERRVALVPESCKKLVQAGFTVAIESGAGAGAFLADDAYRQAGATVEDEPAALRGRYGRTTVGQSALLCLLLGSRSFDERKAVAL